jgi:hypothetical protein
MEPLTDEIVRKLPNGRVARLINNRIHPYPTRDGVRLVPNAEAPSINQAIELIKDARELWREGRLSEDARQLITNEIYPYLLRRNPGVVKRIGTQFETRVNSNRVFP